MIGVGFKTVKVKITARLSIAKLLIWDCIKMKKYTFKSFSSIQIVSLLCSGHR